MSLEEKEGVPPREEFFEFIEKAHREDYPDGVPTGVIYQHFARRYSKQKVKYYLRDCLLKEGFLRCEAKLYSPVKWKHPNQKRQAELNKQREQEDATRKHLADLGAEVVKNNPALQTLIAAKDEILGAVEALKKIAGVMEKLAKIANAGDILLKAAEKEAEKRQRMFETVYDGVQFTRFCSKCDSVLKHIIRDSDSIPIEYGWFCSKCGWSEPRRDGKRD